VCESCVRASCVRETAGGGEGADGSAQPKTRTPHNDVGNDSTCKISI
jgi:hypothetical protein